MFSCLTFSAIFKNIYLELFNNMANYINILYSQIMIIVKKYQIKFKIIKMNFNVKVKDDS